MDRMARVFRMSFASVYPHYVKKVESKGRTTAELHEVIRWLTGYDERGLQRVLADRVDFEHFFADAPRMNPHASLITGVVCGIRVEDIEDPLTQQIRYLDKLIDELAKGKKMESILRQPKAAAPSAPAKNSTAKKATAKKATTKKATAKKATAKKATTKKATAKKTTAKNSTAKKTTASAIKATARR